MLLNWKIILLSKLDKKCNFYEGTYGYKNITQKLIKISFVGEGKGR